jgi:glyoxylase-like metal-dependent hydrolase (beta-lactamase superfamily II)
MAVGQATHLTKPLPGGQQGATVKVTPIKTASMLSPDEFIEMSGGKLKLIRSMLGSREGWQPLPIPVFLIEHPGAGYVLVDTGFHQSVAVDPAQNLGPMLGRLYRGTIEMTPDQSALAQLRTMGIEQTDISTVVMTHMHMDHASAIADFTNPVYVLGEGEWDAFHKRGLTNGYVRKQASVAVDFREIPYSSQNISSYSTFGRSFDLLGDGSIRLVYTPGHTLGHQSLILRLKGRELLITGDALYNVNVLTSERRGYAMADEHKWRRSLREIQLFKREKPDTVIIPGHDPKTWAGLKPSYE